MATSPAELIEFHEATARKMRLAKERYPDLQVTSFLNGPQVFVSKIAAVDATGVEVLSSRRDKSEDNDVWVVPFAEIDGFRVYSKDKMQNISTLLFLARRNHPDQLRALAQYLVG